jgi:uncharacterized Zn-finger protein
MNVTEVRNEMAHIKARRMALEMELEALKARASVIRRYCPHPNQRSYLDMSGTTCVACPDCGKDE